MPRQEPRYAVRRSRRRTYRDEGTECAIVVMNVDTSRSRFRLDVCVRLPRISRPGVCHRDKRRSKHLDERQTRYEAQQLRKLRQEHAYRGRGTRLATRHYLVNVLSVLAVGGSCSNCSRTIVRHATIRCNPRLDILTQQTTPVTVTKRLNN